MKQIKKIIFVCRSGTCRAPMAAAIFTKLLLHRHIEVLARGMLVLFPEPLNQKAEAVMISNGFSVEKYCSQELKAEDITEDTLILAVTKDIQEQIIEKFQYPHVFVLTEYVGEELEILDPYGGTLQAYGLCFEMLLKSLNKLADLINNTLLGGANE